MKNAKKSMFITTILMVAVLIVAVSTATFAWYTASGSGTASEAILTSAKATDANIGLGWTKTTATAADLTLSNAEGATFAPMSVDTIFEADQTYTYDSVAFTTATVDDQNLFNAASIKTGTPWTITNSTEAATNGFYVKNNNTNAGATVDIGIEFTSGKENNDILLVAVFVDGNLKAIFAESLTSYSAGTVTGGQSVTTVNDKGSAFIKNATQTIEIELAASNETDDTDLALIQVKAWFDGETLVQTKADKEAGFSLTFGGETK